MMLRIAVVFAIGGALLTGVGWLGILGPAMLFGAITLTAFEFDGRLNTREVSPRMPLLEALRQVDRPHQTA